MKNHNSLVGIYNRYSDEKRPLIYQMGKVGSVSIENCFDSAIHDHSLRGLAHEPTPSYMAYVRSRKYCSQAFYILNSAKYAAKRYGLRSRNEIKIISGVREPVSRNVSMFFQELYSWIFRYMTGFPDKKTWESSNRSEGIEFLHEAYRLSYDHRYGIDWFDNEFRKVTGVDVYKHEFDKEKGFTIIKDGKYSIFIYRIENLASLSTELSRFLGMDIQIDCSNSGNKKWYSDVYRKFLDTYEFDEEYLDTLLETKFATHFYSKEELTVARQKFLNTYVK